MRDIRDERDSSEIIYQIVFWVFVLVGAVIYAAG